MTQDEIIIDELRRLKAQVDSQKRRRSRMPFRKKMVIAITLFLFVYICVAIYLFMQYQIEMNALTIAVFGAATGEYWQLGKIQQKIQDGRNQHLKDDWGD